MSGPGPTPPLDFASHPLPLLVEPAGVTWSRIHRADKAPIWFGPAPGDPPKYRFDDPLGIYRVCYLGRTLEAAFAETFLRDLAIRVLPLKAFDERAFSEFTTSRETRLVQFHGRGLVQLGATAEVTHGPYDQSRRWARACFEHPGQPDGLLYRARHDDDQLAIALFDRAADALDSPPPVILRTVPDVLLGLLNHYNIGLDP